MRSVTQQESRRVNRHLDVVNELHGLGQEDLVHRDFWSRHFARGQFLHRRRRLGPQRDEHCPRLFNLATGNKIVGRHVLRARRQQGGEGCLLLEGVHPALPLEQVHRHVPAFVEFADEAIGAGIGIVKEFFRELIQSRRRRSRDHGDAFGVHVHEHHGNALVARFSCTNQHRNFRRHRSDTRPKLLSGNSPSVAIRLGLAAQRRQVTSGLWLRKALTPGLAPGHRSAEIGLRYLG